MSISVLLTKLGNDFSTDLGPYLGADFGIWTKVATNFGNHLGNDHSTDLSTYFGPDMGADFGICTQVATDFVNNPQYRSLYRFQSRFQRRFQYPKCAAIRPGLISEFFL